MNSVLGVWAVLLLVGFLGAATFVGLYAYGSRQWWQSPTGRNLMALPAVLAGMLGLSLLGLVWRELPPWLWLGGMASLDAVLWWRVVILWRVQHDHVHD